MSSDNLFEDIEQDNNPSFYGNPSIINDPYSNKSAATKTTSENNSITTDPSTNCNNLNKPDQTNQQQSNIVNSTIGLSKKILELLNEPELSIDIINSEKLVNSSIIVYTIQLSSVSLNSKIVVKRRYSEFKSLRDNLLKLFPTLIIPPIPEKHTILNYLLNSINNSNEYNIIEMRKRYFKLFLNDLIFDSSESVKNCQLLHKFFDPNYELCWYNALNEPPVNLIPNNLLLANPINPTDQNGLYSLLPIVNGFDFNSHIDNLNNLKKINNELYKLNDQIKLYELKGFEQDLNFTIPEDLINFEIKFHQIIKILTDLNKLDLKITKNFKHLINNLIELGGNLNNFSLQIYQQNSNTNKENNQLSESIEKFGSTMDQNFLNFENFVLNQLIPQWQEPINQMIQYHYTSLNLIKFYKYKIIQFKILYKLKFNKFQQLINLSNIGGATTTKIKHNDEEEQEEEEEEVVVNNLDHLKDLNSPTLNNALKNLSIKKISKKSSWYGLFGGNNNTKKFNFQLPVTEDMESSSSQQPHASIKFKLAHIEKELNKLNQLIELCSNDMEQLTKALMNTFKEFLEKLEKKWLLLMLNYIKNCKLLFSENLNNWNQFKEFLVTGSFEEVN
ncbi:unnamed protein product [Candida verbasci]|uniref:PX domain-containing protein n=1 Tax=Candida verbasci TaxID=1227364 RepID=A0A9W4TT35_9ASCO|nr:unnamed protein product [Candida verbasci]